MIYEALIKKYGINHERVLHTLGVKKMAVELANKLGCDSKKAEIAALFHDYYRYEDNDVLLKKMTEYDREKYYGKTYMYHGLAAANAIKEEFNVDDIEISNAIRFHTTGRINMTLLEKILYVSDFADETRTHAHASEIRELAYKDFDKAVFMTIYYIASHIGRIDKETCEMLNMYNRGYIDERFNANC